MDWLRKLLGLHVHDWTKWRVTDRLVSGWHPEDGPIADQQTRECESCGAIQHRAAYYRG
jgi:hypothetical protein